MQKKIDHNEYPKSLRNKPEDFLRFIIKDCQEAIAALPNGPNAGYYADEINYCCMELNRRKKNRQK